MLVIGGVRVFGLAPHELLVLANRNEPASVRIAQAYMQQRRIPRQNLILLALPPSADHGHYTSMTRDAYTREIWLVAQDQIARRGLEHVLAWVFSTHIPYRIEHDPPLSLQGLTFVRNQMPSHEAIAKAAYESPLFAGPASPHGSMRLSHSLFPASQALGERMPIPSMALGYIGPRGNSEAEILAMFSRSQAADASAPSGVVYFVTRDDIRSRVREWQFGPVVDVLKRMGTEAVITNAVPAGVSAALGVMMGTPVVDPSQIGAFVPGAVGEHLTSFGAAFDQSSQTKISRWISAGASGTAGTVTEPYAVWAKFPHARFYVHYRSGCTLLESFYLSLRSPLQIFLLGDPLAAPWVRSAEMRISGVSEGAVVTTARKIDLHIEAPYGTHYGRVLYLINGQIVGAGASFVLDPETLAPGLHMLRAVAYQAGYIQSAVFDEVRFQIAP